MSTQKGETIKPIRLANELGIRPQQVFSWIRTGALKGYKTDEGHHVLRVQDVKEFLSKKSLIAHDRANKIDELVKNL